MSRPLAAFVAACLLAGCAHAPAEAPRTPLLLVSVDGLRPTDVTPDLMPRLSQFARGGVRAIDGMRPSYPSLTFPNHYTLVTGLRPDHHGIVHNTMRDPQLGEFRLTRQEAVGDGRWWGGTPVWVSVERAGLPTATMFWPGSEAAVDGVRPTRWTPFDKAIPANERATRVAGWLLEPATSRPAFATLYFDAVDAGAHSHGPDSIQAREAIRATDAAFGRLLDALAARGMRDAINIVVVSDHGMAEVTHERAVAIEDMAPPELAQVVSGGQVVTFQPVTGHEARARERLLGRHAHYECWDKEELPDRWHYGSNPRIPPIVCQMDEGWDALPAAIMVRRPSATRGSHGYDPALPSMRATFIAAGPAFRAGTTLPLFDNVDVYPLLMRLLRLPAAPNDGDAGRFDAVIAAGQ